jgi:glycosyltransferase involved in cell wall biosynthesis
MIIAPRGQFGAAALQHKASSKQLYMNAFHALGLAHRVLWQATCEIERDEIQQFVGRRAAVQVVPNISFVRPVCRARSPKLPGRLELVYCSRVTPKKNLLGAIQFLRTASGNVTFDIWGPAEDAAYEQRCRQAIASLPKNIIVRWRGELNFDCVAETLSQYDAMLLPTLGENFGHAIIEALAAGCPVVISDRTPWRGLDTLGIGWDLPLDWPRAFQDALTTLSSMDERSHERMRARAIEYATAAARTTDAIEAHCRMFQSALQLSGDSGRVRLHQAA